MALREVLFLTCTADLRSKIANLLLAKKGSWHAPGTFSSRFGLSAIYAGCRLSYSKRWVAGRNGKTYGTSEVLLERAAAALLQYLWKVGKEHLGTIAKPERSIWVSDAVVMPVVNVLWKASSKPWFHSTNNRKPATVRSLLIRT